MSGNATWYIHRDGENLGPFDAPTIAAAIADGTFAPTELWWDTATESWRALADHPALAGEIATRATGATRDEPAGSAMPPAPAAGPLSQPSGRELVAAWPSLCALIPALPAPSSSPFVCDSCGNRFGLSQLHYARASYLCADCHAAGAAAKTAPLAPLENPLAQAVLKHAHVWALILILVPFFGFKLLADMMDPYKSYPPVYPHLKQATSILARDAELKPLDWAHAIRQTLLASAHKAATAAQPLAGDGERDLAHIAVLLTLEGLGRETEAAEFIAAHPNVEPTARKDEQVRKFFFVEARLLARGGRADLIGNRLDRIAPAVPMEPGYAPFGMVRRPAITSPLLSGQKEYAVELASQLYDAIACDDELVSAFYASLPSTLRTPTEERDMAVGGEEGFGASYDGAAASSDAAIAQFHQLKKEGEELVSRIEASGAARNAGSGRNAGLDEARLGRAVESALRGIAAGARAVRTNLNSRDAGGFDVQVNIESPRGSDLGGAVRALTGSTFAYALLLTDLGASRYVNRNQVSWTFDLRFAAPPAKAGASDPRTRFGAEFQPLTDTAEPSVRARLTTARMFVQELRREIAERERNAPRAVADVFGPAEKLVDLVMASANSLSSFRASAHSLQISGTEPGTAALEGLKNRLAPLASEHSLEPAVRTNRTTRENREVTEWYLEYAVPRR